jgi:predicted nucleic acid-binding protein
MPTVYLETSFVSACITDRTDAGSVYRRQVSLDWWAGQRRRHDVHVSDVVIAELSHPAYPHREVALAFVEDARVIPVTEEMAGLAEILIRERVMPGPLGGDALHVAAATIARMEYLLSWNVRHLANPNKLQHLGIVCLRLGFAPPCIVTPENLWET